MKDEGEVWFNDVCVGLGKYYFGIIFVGLSVSRLISFTGCGL